MARPSTRGRRARAAGTPPAGSTGCWSSTTASSNTWLLRDSNSGRSANISFTFGRADDFPTSGTGTATARPRSGVADLDRQHELQLRPVHRLSDRGRLRRGRPADRDGRRCSRTDLAARNSKRRQRTAQLQLRTKRACRWSGARLAPLVVRPLAPTRSSPAILAVVRSPAGTAKSPRTGPASTVRL